MLSHVGSVIQNFFVNHRSYDKSKEMGEDLERKKHCYHFTILNLTLSYENVNHIPVYCFVCCNATIKTHHKIN